MSKASTADTAVCHTSGKNTAVVRVVELAHHDTKSLLPDYTVTSLCFVSAACDENAFRLNSDSVPL